MMLRIASESRGIVEPRAELHQTLAVRHVLFMEPRGFARELEQISRGCDLLTAELSEGIEIPRRTTSPQMVPDTEATADVRVTSTLPVHCMHCGCRAQVTVSERGIAIVTAPGFGLSDAQRCALTTEAHELATKRAYKFARQTATLLPCPHCGGRNQWAVIRHVVGVVVSTLVTLAIAIWCSYLVAFADGDVLERGSCVIIGLAAYAFAVYYVRSTWKDYLAALRGARWTDVIPGRAVAVSRLSRR